MHPVIRNSVPADAHILATLWHDGWQDAHAAVVPEELVRIRTRSAFLERVLEHGGAFRVIGDVGAPVAMSLVLDDELYQFYVGAPGRGTGMARVLLTDALGQIAMNGAQRGWLSCAIGNDRAARFYEKNGWERMGEMETVFEGADGPFTMTSWRYEVDVSLLSRAEP